MSEDDPWGGNGEADPWAVAVATGSAPKPKEAETHQGWKKFTPGKAELPEDLQGNKSGGGRQSKAAKQKVMPSGPNLPRKRVTEKKIAGQVLEWKGKYGWIQPSEVVQHSKAYKHGGKIFVSVTDLGGVRQLYPGSSCSFHVFEDEAGLGAEDVTVTDEGGVVSLGLGKNNFGKGKGGKGGKGGRGGYDSFAGKGGGSAGRGGGRFGGMQTGIIPGLEPEHLGLGKAHGRSGPSGNDRFSKLQQGYPGQDSSFGGGGRKGGGAPFGGRGGRGRGDFGDGSSGPSGGGRGGDAGQLSGGGRGGLGRGSGPSGGPSGGLGRGGFGGGFGGLGGFDRNPGGPGNTGMPRPPNTGLAAGGDGWDPLMGQTLHMDKAIGAAMSGASGGTAGMMAPMAPSNLPSMAMGGMGGLPMGGSAAVGMSVPGPGMGGAIGPLAMGVGGPGVIGGMGGMPGMGGMNGMGGMSAMGGLGAAAMPGGPGYGGFGQLGPVATSLGAPGSAPGAFGGPPMPANDLMANPWWPGR